MHALVGSYRGRVTLTEGRASAIQEAVPVERCRITEVVGEGTRIGAEDQRWIDHQRKFRVVVAYLEADGSFAAFVGTGNDPFFTVGLLISERDGLGHFAQHR